MLAAGLITLREGLEAALIVGIVLGYLKMTGRMERQRTVWWGVALAVLASIAVALGLHMVGANFEGRGEQIFEGVVMLLAAGVLTYMIFWMMYQGRQMKSQLETETSHAVQAGGWALFTLAFLAVFREGIETALFLTAAAFASSPAEIFVGGALGLATAVLAGWVLFAASVRLDVRRFFQVTSLLLVVFAAGLVAHGINELQQAAVLPVLVEHVWDINPILDENSLGGSLLKTLFGYNGNPSLLEVLGYVGFFVVIWLATRSKRLSPTKPPAEMSS
ncbi:MAG: FTR1 family protein [Anaerolineae bacterium]|nr:FTR1 family protein [Anaerolineae bacterium]